MGIIIACDITRRFLINTRNNSIGSGFLEVGECSYCRCLIRRSDHYDAKPTKTANLDSLRSSEANVSHMSERCCYSRRRRLTIRVALQSLYLEESPQSCLLVSAHSSNSPTDPLNMDMEGTTVLGAMIVLSSILAQSLMTVNLPFRDSQRKHQDKRSTHDYTILANLYHIAY